jgi:hypothetical protein
VGPSTGEEIGSDLAKIKENLDNRMSWVRDVNLLDEARKGVEIARGEVESIC